jgi:dipeptidase
VYNQLFIHFFAVWRLGWDGFVEINSWRNKRMKKLLGIKVWLIYFFGILPVSVVACTNFLVTKGASTDGSTMITYTADSHDLYGELAFFPAQSHLHGEKLKIFEGDEGTYLGEIDQIPYTFKVVGNINEYQVAIGETTFGGRKELQNKAGIMDYNNLMIVALQRAKTARQAIEVMTDLVAKYGYNSSGESMSISDPNEVWIFEIIGKGPETKGAVWVALRVPEGYVSAHANQARIRKFSLNDQKNCFYAADVISFAREKGYFKGEDKDFSFVDAYAPPDFGGLRFCEARVWSFFNRIAPSLKLPMDYIKGNPDAEPLPLWIKPDKKLSVRDLMEYLRDHYQGTDLDLSKGVGAGPFSCPYRWRPMTWKVDGKTYLHERSIATQQTGFSFVSQSRSWLPNSVGGVLWFGMDDTNSTVYIPMYCSINEIPPSFAVGAGNFNEFSWDSAFWVFNFVANYAYLRYKDMIQDIKIVQQQFEGQFMAAQPEVDKTAVQLLKVSENQAIGYLTNYSVSIAEKVVKRWRKLGEFLIWKYLDGNVRDEHGKVTHPPYAEEWYRKIISEQPDHFKVIEKKAEEN